MGLGSTILWIFFIVLIILTLALNVIAFSKLDCLCDKDSLEKAHSAVLWYSSILTGIAVLVLTPWLIYIFYKATKIRKEHENLILKSGVDNVNIWVIVVATVIIYISAGLSWGAYGNIGAQINNFEDSGGDPDEVDIKFSRIVTGITGFLTLFGLIFGIVFLTRSRIYEKLKDVQNEFSSAMTTNKNTSESSDVAKVFDVCDKGNKERYDQRINMGYFDMKPEDCKDCWDPAIENGVEVPGVPWCYTY